MIIDKIENIEKYSQIPISVIKFIKNLTPETPVGHYELENGIFANIDKYTTKLFENCKFEAHKKYIDIQILTTGTERLDYINIEGLAVSEEYDQNRDVMFFENPTTDMLELQISNGPGQKTIINENNHISGDISRTEAASRLNITPDKIVEGNTILGVEGTAKLGTPTYESLEALQVTTGSEGDIAVVIDSTNTYIGTYKYNTTNSTWEEIVSTTAYDATLTNDEYDEALVASNDILG